MSELDEQIEQAGDNAAESETHEDQACTYGHLADLLERKVSTLEAKLALFELIEEHGLETEPPIGGDTLWCVVHEVETGFDRYEAPTLPEALAKFKATLGGTG